MRIAADRDMFEEKVSLSSRSEYKTTEYDDDDRNRLKSFNHTLKLYTNIQY